MSFRRELAAAAIGLILAGCGEVQETRVDSRPPMTRTIENTVFSRAIKDTVHVPQNSLGTIYFIPQLHEVGRDPETSVRDMRVPQSQFNAFQLMDYFASQGAKTIAHDGYSVGMDFNIEALKQVNPQMAEYLRSQSLTDEKVRESLYGPLHQIVDAGVLLTAKHPNVTIVGTEDEELIAEQYKILEGMKKAAILAEYGETESIKSEAMNHYNALQQEFLQLNFPRTVSALETYANILIERGDSIGVMTLGENHSEHLEEAVNSTNNFPFTVIRTSLK